MRQLFAQRRKQKVGSGGGNPSGNESESTKKRSALRPIAVGRDKSYPLQPLQRWDQFQHVLTDAEVTGTDKADALKSDKKEIGDEQDQNDTKTHHVQQQQSRGRWRQKQQQQRNLQNQDSCHLPENRKIKIPSLPTIIDTFDTAIFGKLPNLGGELLSRRKINTEETEFGVDDRSCASVTVLTMSTSRIPKSPFHKITRGVSKLTTSDNADLPGGNSSCNRNQSTGGEKIRTSNQRQMRQVRATATTIILVKHNFVTGGVEEFSEVN